MQVIFQERRPQPLFGLDPRDFGDLGTDEDEVATRVFITQEIEWVVVSRKRYCSWLLASSLGFGLRHPFELALRQLEQGLAIGMACVTATLWRIMSHKIPTSAKATPCDQSEFPIPSSRRGPRRKDRDESDPSAATAAAEHNTRESR